jgi:hypothetical protein
MIFAVNADFILMGGSTKGLLISLALYVSSFIIIFACADRERVIGGCEAFPVLIYSIVVLFYLECNRPC